MGVLRDPHGHQRVAGVRSRRTREALALEAHLLAVAEAGGNLDVDVLAGREAHAALGAARRFRQRDRHFGGRVLPGGRRAEIVLLELRAGMAAAAAAEAAEHAA